MRRVMIEIWIERRDEDKRIVIKKRMRDRKCI